MAWGYVNCGLPKLPLCVADFRSWETLHPGLIWSLDFPELLRAPLTPCLFMEAARIDRQGVGRGDLWAWLFF